MSKYFHLAFRFIRSHMYHARYEKRGWRKRKKKVWRLFMFVERKRLGVSMCKYDDEEIEGLVVVFFKVIEPWILWFLCFDIKRTHCMEWDFRHHDFSSTPLQLAISCVDNFRTRVMCICLIYRFHCINKSLFVEFFFSRWKNYVW